MRDRLRKWVFNSNSPTDFYQLLGFPRFYSVREHLLKAAIDANRYLLGFQNHADPAVVARARELQMRVAQASGVFSDEAKWKAHDAALSAELRRLYAAEHGHDATHWRQPSLRRWLEVVHGVSPDRVEGLVHEFLAAAVPRPSEERDSAGTGPGFPDVCLHVFPRTQRAVKFPFSAPQPTDLPKTSGNTAPSEARQPSGRPPSSPAPAARSAAPARSCGADATSASR